MRVKNSQKIFSENVIQIILTSQELARAENSQSVELHHILRSLIYHKKSSAGVILEKLKIQEKDINFPKIQNNAFFFEVALSKSSQKILQKALEESNKVERWNTDFRSIFILKAIILDKSESLNCFFDDFDKKKLEIYQEIKKFEESIPEIPKSESSLLPINIFAEKAILGSILLDSNVINRIEENLKVKYFYSYIHQDIFRCALFLKSQKKRTDLKEMRKVLLKKGLLEKIGGDNYLIELVESIPGILPLEQKINSLKKNYFARRKLKKNTPKI